MPSPRRKTNNNITGEHLLKFRCSQCANCCRLHVPVTDADVRRLMDATGRPAREIVQFFTPSDFESSPGPVAWTRLGRGDRRVMCLRESGDRCFFLRRKRCTVYAHRPIVCREHPFDLTLDDSERRIEVVELNLPCECLHTMDGKTSKREIKKIHRLSLQQDADYFALVRKWNRQAKRGTERDFLKFTGLGD